MLTVEGRCGGGIAFQDSAQVRPCSLFLDFLSVVLKCFAELTQVAPRQLLLRYSTSCIPAVVRIHAPATYRSS